MWHVWGEERCIQSFGEETRTLGRPVRVWEDNIKMDLQEIRWGGCGPD
jgi:hypothetical protein